MTNTNGDTPNDTILNRIRGLLAKAEGTDNPHEADAFAAKAFALMDKHRIAEAHVRDGLNVTERIDSEVFDLTRTQPLRASVTLLATVATHYSCVITVPHSGGTKVCRLHGHDSDRMAVRMMFTSLLIQRDRACINTGAPVDVNPTTFRNSFAYGFAFEVGERLTDLRRVTTEANAHDSVALAVIDRSLAVRDSMPATRRSSMNAPSLDRSGLADGRTAGRSADLGTSARVGSTSSTRALGR